MGLFLLLKNYKKVPKNNKTPCFHNKQGVLDKYGI